MSHTATASLSIRLFDNGRIEVHHAGDLDALMDYLEETMRIVAEKKQAKEAA